MTAAAVLTRGIGFGGVNYVPTLGFDVGAAVVVVPTPVSKPDGAPGRGPRAKPAIFRGRVYDPVRDRVQLARDVQAFLDEQEKLTEAQPKKRKKKRKLKTIDVEIEAPSVYLAPFDIDALREGLEALALQQAQVNQYITALRKLQAEMDDEDDAITVLLLNG